MQLKNPFIVSLVTVTALSLGACEKKAGSSSKAAPANAQNTTEVARADWCAEHGVPESICTRCNPKLIAEFKQKGDWCKEHNLPESQCIECNPDLKEKFEAMKPKPGK